MSTEREKIEHPSWCDRELCTAPEYRPTSEEYRGAAEATAPPVDDNEDEAADEEPMCELSVNDSTTTRGTLQQVQAEVAQIVTASLAINPDTFALEAQTMNMAFTGGSVRAALDERGEWSTLFGVATGKPVRIRVTREG